MSFQNKSEFTWTGIDSSGIKVSGKIFSDTKKNAHNKLENNNITALSIKKANSFFLFSFTRKITRKDRLDFTHQLLLLIQSGIPLADALTLIANASSHPVYQNIINTIKEKIVSGSQLSTALSHFPEHFDTAHCKMIAAGEQSGRLEMVLEQLIENQENRIKIQRKITQALLYPISIICIAIAITVGLLIFVIPQFHDIYNNFGAQLPTMTRYLIAMSHNLKKHGLFFILSVSSIVLPIKIFLKKRKRSDRLKNALYHFMFKIPIVQSVMATEQITRWSQLLSMTLSSGISLIDALQIANQAISQPVLQKQLEEARESVITGKSLRAALDQCCFFSDQIKTMIAIGENADALSTMMKKIAVFYQHHLNETLDRLSKLLEPVIMITIASFVSGLIIAMYLPIFRMGNII